jgi:hypothetical protein
MCPQCNIVGWLACRIALQTPLLLGGGANVKCISSVWRPAGPDSGVVVYKAFYTNWHDWSFVEVIRAVDLFVGRFAGIMA